MIVLAAIPAPSWTAMYLAAAAAFFVVAAGVYAIGALIRGSMARFVIAP